MAALFTALAMLSGALTVVCGYFALHSTAPDTLPWCVALAACTFACAIACLKLISAHAAAAVFRAKRADLPTGRRAANADPDEPSSHH